MSISLFLFRLRRSRPHFFIFGTKSTQSGLGSGSMSSAMKFCIEWSNRELLRPYRRRYMTISLFLFRLRRSHPQFSLVINTKSNESGLGCGSKSSALKFCIEWSNRELPRPSRRRDMTISLFLSVFGDHALTVFDVLQ